MEQAQVELEQEQVELEVFIDGKPLPVSGWENVWGETFAKEGRDAAVQLLLRRADIEHRRELGIVRTIEKSHRRPLPADIPQTPYEIELRRVAAEVAVIDPARVTLQPAVKRDPQVIGSVR